MVNRIRRRRVNKTKMSSRYNKYTPMYKRPTDSRIIKTFTYSAACTLGGNTGITGLQFASPINARYYPLAMFLKSCPGFDTLLTSGEKVGNSSFRKIRPLYIKITSMLNEFIYYSVTGYDYFSAAVSVQFDLATVGLTYDATTASNLMIIPHGKSVSKTYKVPPNTVGRSGYNSFCSDWFDITSFNLNSEYMNGILIIQPLFADSFPAAFAPCGGLLIEFICELKQFA